MRWRLVAPVAVLVSAVVAGCAAPVTTDPGVAVAQQTREPLPSWTAPPSAAFTVVASGDVLIHPALTEQAAADGGGTRDYEPLFAGVRSVVDAADLAICHLEVPLDPDGPYEGYPTFNSPPEVATALARTGYDACSTASNHTLDQGPDGVFATLDVLDGAGIAHTGSARTADEAATPRVLDVGGTKVGLVSFTFGFNGMRVPSATPWLANQLDADDVLAAARRAKDAGAEVVIASLHWGNEYESQPTEQQQSLARTILGDDAVDLIIGHHAHVVQPFEQIGGEWVAYGLGNHVARHASPRGVSEEGVVARFRFARGDDGRWAVEKAEYVPTLIELGPPIRLIDLTTSAATPRNDEALARVDEVVTSRGAPVTRTGR